VLRTIAARLQAFFREGDLVVRTGWREFAVVVRSNGGPGWPEAMAERLLLAIGGPISSDDGFVSVAASIGILSSEDHVPGADPFVVAHTGMERSRFDGGARWTRCLPRTAS
jgi:GGDEF domain-containing protein